jgi:hypothetical protein
MQTRTGFFEKKFWAFICTGLLLVVGYDLWWVLFDPDISLLAKAPRILLFECLRIITFWLWHNGPAWVYHADESGLSHQRYTSAITTKIESSPWEAIARIDTTTLRARDANGNKIFDLTGLRRYSPIERTRFLDYIEDELQRSREHYSFQTGLSRRSIGVLISTIHS